MRALAAACLLLALATVAVALENKCGACVAVQHELTEILFAERPRANLDFRHRLNSQGKREGKVVDYKVSELRTLEILEGLCEKMKKYSLFGPKDSKKRVWTHGQTYISDRLKLIAEEQGKELKRWCDRMLEYHEDEMAEMIRKESETAYKDLPILLCRNITSNCKNEEAYLKEVKRVAPHLPGKDGNLHDVPGTPKTEVTETTDDSATDEKAKEGGAGSGASEGGSEEESAKGDVGTRTDGKAEL